MGAVEGRQRATYTAAQWSTLAPCMSSCCSVERSTCSWLTGCRRAGERLRSLLADLIRASAIVEKDVVAEAWRARRRGRSLPGDGADAYGFPPTLRELRRLSCAAIPDNRRGREGVTRGCGQVRIESLREGQTKNNTQHLGPFP